MGKEIITLGEIAVEKCKFHRRKNLVLLEDILLRNYRCLIWFLQVKKIINILLVKKMIIKKLNHYG